MQYAQLGNSLTVSRIALGCMSYGDPAWRPWVLDEPAAQPFFRRALEAGITFFDTANMYSLGRSEEVTGRALKTMARREDVVIATKVFYAAGGAQTEGLSRAQIVQACEASLRRLGIETIDLYQIHRFDRHVPIDETLEALNDLVRAGKVRFLGASSTFAWRLLDSLSTSERHGWARFVSMQNHYNLLYREEEREMIPMCRERGVGIIPWSPLARGLLARPRPADARVRSSHTARSSTDDYSLEIYDNAIDWDIVEAVNRIARARGVSMAEVAMAWLVSRPGVTAPIVGATKLSHLDAALRSLSLTLTAAEVDALEAPYRPHKISGHDY